MTRIERGAAMVADRSAALAEPDAFLARLGERVRDARARRGMTRKGLSQDSGVSQRYLAELENGRGNVSILLLRQIAQAMNLDPADLVRAGPDPAPERALLDAFVGRLTADQLNQALDHLHATFGRGLGRTERIALIGLRGAGKSTIGAALAKHLDLPFIELVREIEADAGMPVDEIYSLSGQAAFRRHERRSLERVVEAHPRAVIAAGGGIVAEAGNYGRLLDTCFTIWLKAAPEDHMRRVVAQGDHRPMAGNDEALDDLAAILRNREALYAKADITLETSGRDAGQVTASALAALGEAGFPLP